MAKNINAYVMFSDIKGFSKLESETKDFVEKLWPQSLQAFERYRDQLLVFNSWGDALIVVFEDPAVLQAVVSYRDFFRNLRLGIPALDNLQVRIACHFGDFYQFKDPVTARNNVIGRNVNLAARLEPVTRPGFIFVTQAFKDQWDRSAAIGRLDNLALDKIGEVELAKEFGTSNTYVLRTSDEAPHVIDRLIQQDLIKALPDSRELDAKDGKRLSSLKALEPEMLSRVLDDELVKAEPPSRPRSPRSANPRGCI